MVRMDLVKTFSDFQKINPPVSRWSTEEKSDRKSNEFRENGNKFYREDEMMKSLLCYNKAINYACSKKVRSLGYANRSAVYFELKHYNECLKNIKWARKNDYPPEKMEKLNERESKCKELLEAGGEKSGEDEIELWDYIKMSYPANEKIPWIVDCLELRQEGSDRGIYATRDLRAGDIISIEKPLVHFEDEDVLYRRCYNCFKVALMNLIPCKKTSSLMFCSTTCRKAMYQRHADQPEYMKVVLSDDVRTILELEQLFGGREKYSEYMEKVQVKDFNKTIFDYDFSDPNNPDNGKNRAICLLSLPMNPEIVPFEPAKTSNVPMVQFGETKNQHSWAPYQILKRIWNIASRRNRMSACLYGISFGDFYQDGAGFVLFSSLLNEACTSNAFRLLVDDKVVTFINKPLKAGEEILLPKGNIIGVNASIVIGLVDSACDCRTCAAGIVESLTKSQRQFVLDSLKYDFAKADGKRVMTLLCQDINAATVASHVAHYSHSLEQLMGQIIQKFVLPAPIYC